MIKPNTYTQIHIQFVFAVKYRAAVIGKEWEEELYQYITGIVKQYNHKLLAINGMPDHIHILIGKRPTQSESDLMELVKGSSSKWINQRQFLKSHFAWQEGFGAFSYTKSHVDSVIGYIRKQKEHHSNKETFIEEYLRILTELDMDFDQRYIFKDLE